MTCEGCLLDTSRWMLKPEFQTSCGSSSVTDLSTSLRIIAISMPRKKRLMLFQVIMLSNPGDVGATGGRRDGAVGFHPHNPRWPSGDNWDRNAPGTENVSGTVLPPEASSYSRRSATRYRTRTPVDLVENPQVNRQNITKRKTSAYQSPGDHSFCRFRIP